MLRRKKQMDNLKVKKICLTPEFSPADKEIKHPRETFFFKIIKAVELIVEDGLIDEHLKLEEIHPRLLISFVISNIVINLFTNCAHGHDYDVKSKMLASLLTEIEQITIEGFKLSLTADDQILSGATH